MTEMLREILLSRGMRYRKQNSVNTFRSALSGLASNSSADWQRCLDC